MTPSPDSPPLSPLANAFCALVGKTIELPRAVRFRKQQVEWFDADGPRRYTIRCAGMFDIGGGRMMPGVLLQLTDRRRTLVSVQQLINVDLALAPEEQCQALMPYIIAEDPPLHPLGPE